MQGSALTRLDDDIWEARRPLELSVGDIGGRMTVIRLPGDELFLHSPVALDDATRAALDQLGSVRWVVGPSKVHHFFLGDYARIPRPHWSAHPACPRSDPTSASTTRCTRPARFASTACSSAGCSRARR